MFASSRVPCALRHGSYPNGKPYRAPRSSILPSEYLEHFVANPCIAVDGPATDWSDLWNAAQQKLREARFATSTLMLYRRVLRTFMTFATTHPHPALRAERPSDVHKALAEDFIHHINRDRASRSWISSNITVLRTVFDKLADFTITTRLQTPKRPWHLPEILSPSEATKLIQTASTIRDRLIIGLMYGCGMKVGEVCALRWKDIDVVRRTITIRYNRDTQVREVPILDALYDLLKLGTEKCPPTDHVFPGAVAGKPLTARLIERMVRKISEAAGIEKIVTCMALRHSYAVNCLRDGMSDVQLQQNLGHCSIETTPLPSHRPARLLAV